MARNKVGHVLAKSVGIKLDYREEADDLVLLRGREMKIVGGPG
jgi:hypothetical protein